jgi:hypothetical protein
MKSSEVVPSSYDFFVTTNRILFTQIPFLATCVRYRTTDDVYFFFEISKREYGDWKLYAPSGLLLIEPKLFLSSKESYLCFRNVQQPFEFTLDGERSIEL